MIRLSANKAIYVSVSSKSLVLQFTREAYTVLLAMELLSIASVDDKPASYPESGTTSEKNLWLEALANRIVEEVIVINNTRWPWTRGAGTKF